MKNKLLTFATALFVSTLITFGASRPSVSATATFPSEDMRCGEHWLQVHPVYSSQANGSKKVVAELTVPSFLAGRTVTATADTWSITAPSVGSNVILNYDGTDVLTQNINSTADKSNQVNVTLGATGTKLDMIVQFGPTGSYDAQNKLTVRADCNITGSLVCGSNSIIVPFAAIYGHNGFVSPLAILTVPTNLQGLTVNTTASTTNNVSVHPNSNIIVKSNATSYTLDDVESFAGKVTTKTSSLTLGSNLEIDVQIGSDQVYSAGGDLNLVVTCPSGGSGGGTVVSAPQVVAPVGAVAAGGGGGSTSLSLGASLGLFASLISMAAGLRELNKR